MSTNPAYYIERNYVSISSIDRNITAYPSSTEFRVTIPDDGFKDVVSIELTAGTVPKLDGVENDPYLLLSIEELNHLRTSGGKEYFSVLSLHKGHSDLFFNMDRSSSAIMPAIFYAPRQRVRTLTIKLLHANGTSLNFGGTLDQAKQTSFIFEAKTRMRLRTDFDEDFREVF